MLNSIDRVMIATNDLEKAQRDAVSLLARTPSWQGDYPSLGLRYVLFCLENTRIELLAPAEGEKDGLGLHEHLDQNGPGLFGLAFSTSDVEESVQLAKARGWESEGIESVLAQDGPSGAYRRLSQADLDRVASRGIRLSLTQTLSEDDVLPPALPIGEESATVTRVDHVVIGTQDPDHAISFYGDGLGIHLALDRTFESRGIRLLFFRLGGTTLEFSAPIREGAELSEGSESTDRLWGLAYQVPDADGAWSRLQESGFETTEVRPGHKPGTRVFTVKSPSLGIPTLVIEPST